MRRPPRPSRCRRSSCRARARTPHAAAAEQAVLHQPSVRSPNAPALSTPCCRGLPRKLPWYAAQMAELPRKQQLACAMRAASRTCRVDHDAQVAARHGEHVAVPASGCLRADDRWSVMSVASWRPTAGRGFHRSANRSLFARNTLDQVLPAAVSRSSHAPANCSANPGNDRAIAAHGTVIPSAGPRRHRQQCSEGPEHALVARQWQRGEPGAWSPVVTASVQLRYRLAGARGLQPGHRRRPVAGGLREHGHAERVLPRCPASQVPQPR